MAIKTRTTITTASLMEELGLSRRNVQAIRSKLDWAAQDALRKAVKEDFMEKASHRKGAWGSPWKPIAPSTIQRKGHDIIGIDTGKMQKSLRVTKNNRGITAEYRQDYSKHFDAKRPILPTELPPKWEKAIEKAIKASAERHIGKKR